MLKRFSLNAQPYELQSKWDRLGVYAYFPLQCFMYFTKVIGHSVNLFVGIPSNILFVFLSIRRFFDLLKDRTKNICDFLVLIFLLYALFTGFYTIINGFPFVCITTSLKIFILPILFYFWGRNSQDTSNKFNKIFVVTCFVVMVVGLYLHLTMPAFYSNYLYETFHSTWSRQGVEASEDTIIYRQRFRSFLSSSYSVCFFAVSSLAIVLRFFFKKRDYLFFQTRRYNVWLLSAMTIVFLISSVLCFQRIAMVCSVAILLFYFLYGMKQRNMRLMIGFVLILIGGFIYMELHVTSDRDVQILENLIERLESLDFDDAMSQRTGQYKFIEDNWSKYLLGTGLGSAGNKAMELGYQGVTDGEYFRLYAEQGIIGVFTLFLIALLSIVKGAKYFKVYNSELAIIVFFLLACIGANALSGNLWTGIFWYSIGRIWNKSYLQREILYV